MADGDRRGCYSVNHGGVRGTMSVPMTMAFKILLRWPHRNPGPHELQAEYGMSRATAYRYINSLIEARGMMR